MVKGKGSDKIGVSRLKGISILFEEDVYSLAFWLLQMDLAHSTDTTKHRHTLKGLANHYVSLTRIESSKVEEAFRHHGLSLRATIERDEDAS